MSSDLFGNAEPCIGRVVLSPDRRHRYLWECVWGLGLPPLAMGALNPSTADEAEGDPTVDRMVTRGRAWGFGRFMMWNAAAYRSTDPKGIYGNPDAIGPENDLWIERIVREVVSAGGLLLYGWGTNLAKALPGRAEQVDRIVRAAGGNPHALKVTKDGHPQHPLYLGYDARPVPFVLRTAVGPTPKKA